MWSYVGIAVGGFAYFMLGGLWYMVLFRERWTATGRTEEEFADGPQGGGMGLTLIGCLVSTAVLAFVFEWAGGAGVEDGLIVGAILGAGVSAMEAMKRAVFSFDERGNDDHVAGSLERCRAVPVDPHLDPEAQLVRADPGSQEGSESRRPGGNVAQSREPGHA